MCLRIILVDCYILTYNLTKHAIRIPDFQVWIEDASSHIFPSNSFLQLDVVDLP